ncbi:hypothetical protein J6590_056460 [Homalodisca vitripennis]|nr:hypothetical protein J6590_056460 [Homalodisca vitripennis]
MIKYCGVNDNGRVSGGAARPGSQRMSSRWSKSTSQRGKVRLNEQVGGESGRGVSLRAMLQKLGPVGEPIESVRPIDD